MNRENEQVSPQIHCAPCNSMQFTSKGAGRCHWLFFAFKQNIPLSGSQWCSLEEGAPCVERSALVKTCLPWHALYTERGERDELWQTLWSTSVSIRSSLHKETWPHTLAEDLLRKCKVSIYRNLPLNVNGHRHCTFSEKLHFHFIKPAGLSAYNPSPCDTIQYSHQFKWQIWIKPINLGAIWFD